MLISSSNIDTSKVNSLFRDVEKVSFEKKIQEQKAIVSKKISAYKNNNGLNLISPLTHAKEVLELVCECLSIDVNTVSNKSKINELVDARHIYCFIIIKLSSVEITLADAGLIIKRDHATVLNSIRKTCDFNQTSIPFREKLDKCISQFKKRFSGAESYILDYNNIPQY